MKSKKFLALFVATVMCLPMALTSCDKLSKKDIEADPIGRINQSVCDTADSIVKSLSPLDPIRAAEKKGSFEFSLAPADHDATLGLKGAYDTEAKKLAGELTVGAGEAAVSAKLNVENDKVALSAPDLYEGAYGFEFSTFLEDLKNSQLLELSGIDYDEFIGQLQPMLDKMKNPADTSSLSDAGKKLGDDLKARLNKCVSSIEKKDVTIGGGEVKAFEVVFKLAKTDIADVLVIFRDDLKTILETYANLLMSTTYISSDSDSSSVNPADIFDYSHIAEEFDEVISGLNKEGNDATAEVTAYLSPKTCDFMGLRFVITAVNGEDKTTGRIEGGVELSAESKPGKLNGTFKVTHKTADEDEKVDCDAKFSLECVDDDKTFSVKLSAESVSLDSVDGENYDETYTNGMVIDFNNDKAAKTYVLKSESKYIFDPGNDESEKYNSFSSYEMSGNMEYDATNLTVTVDKIVSDFGSAEGGISTVDIEPTKHEQDGIGLTFKLSADAGEITMPEYKNIWKINEGEILDFVLQIQGNAQKVVDLVGKLGEVFPGLSTPEIDGPGIGDTDKTLFDICDSFEDGFDYNFDGKLDEADRLEWEEMFKPYGSVFDETFDYDDDGKTGTDADKDAYNMIVSMYKNMPLYGDDDYDDGFNPYTSEYNEDWDYDYDGKTGTDADREEYEKYYKIFAQEFDPTIDYDQDGKVDDDDRMCYDMVRNEG